MAQTELILQTVVKGTETATKALNDVKGSLDGINNSAKKASSSVPTFSEKIAANKDGFKSLGIAAGIATTGITLGIKGSMKEATDFQNAMTGLQSIAEGTGKDFNKSKQFIQDFTKDGLVTAADAATSLKNLFSRGFSLEESIVLMDRFKDSSSFGRQSSLLLGEAIRGATEGLKNENSMLVDNSGITKNVAAMWKEYAKEKGISYDNLTLEQKREAEYQGILKESQFQVGDAAKLSETYAGKVAMQDAAFLQLKQTIGNALMPVMGLLYEMLTNIITPIKNWIEENPKLFSAITIVVGGIVAFTTAIGLLALVVGPITAAIAAIGVVAGVIVSPIVIATGVILALGTALYTVWKNWDTIRPTLILVWEQIKRDISAIVGSIIQYVIGGFDAMMKKIDEAINYLAEKARQAKEYVSSVLSSAGTSYTSGFLSKPGQALGNLIYGKYANGGSVGGGKPILVGEKGPEIFTPNMAGNIIPNNKIGGGSSIIINISGVFGSDAVGEISDAIVTNLKRASYV